MVQEGLRNVQREGTESEIFDNDVASEVTGDDEFVPPLSQTPWWWSLEVSPPAIRAALAELDTVDLVVCSPSCFDKDSTSFSPEPIRQRYEVRIVERERLEVVHASPTFALVHATDNKSKLARRFQHFAWWMSLLRVSRQCTEDASRAQSNKRRRYKIDQDLERRAAHALALVQMWELSARRQEKADLTPATQQTWESLRDPNRIMEHEPAERLQLDEHKFGTNFRKSKRGATAGPSSTTLCGRCWTIQSHHHFLQINLFAFFGPPRL